MGTDRRLFRRAGFKRLERNFAVFLLSQLLDLEFGLLQTGLASLEQFGAFFIFREQLGQRHFALFHRVNDGFELEERCLKTEFGSLV